MREPTRHGREKQSTLADDDTGAAKSTGWQYTGGVQDEYEGVQRRPHTPARLARSSDARSLDARPEQAPSLPCQGRLAPKGLRELHQDQQKGRGSREVDHFLTANRVRAIETLGPTSAGTGTAADGVIEHAAGDGGL